MKSAMLLEYDADTRGQLGTMLKSLGYVVAAPTSAQGALHTAQAIRFDVVLTCTEFNADDRRAFMGELGRLAPGATMIHLLDADSSGAGYHDRNSALLFKPVTLRSLRRVIDFGIDGMGAQPSYLGPDEERRRQGQRRMRAR